MTEIYGFLAKGGIMMIPIGLGSILALAIFLERIWALRRPVVIPDGFVARIVALVRKGQVGEALATCKGGMQAPAARVASVILDNAALSEEDLKAAVEEAGKRESLHLNRFVEALGTIASIEPLMGLLGTVFGMIQVFQQVVYSSSQGAVDPGRLADGIWQALITTAAGLVVAIPAFIGYKFLASRVDRLTMALEECALSVQLALKAPQLGTQPDEDLP